MKTMKQHLMEEAGKTACGDNKLNNNCLTDPFDVLDALGGSITGEYHQDLKRLEKRGKTCTKQVYYDAYQMSEQP